MICPCKKKGETSVVDSRPTEDGTAIRRRRLCVCGERFTTFERIQYRELMVVKKNGRKSADLRPFFFTTISSRYCIRSKVVNLSPHTQSLLLLMAVPSSVGLESTTEVSPFFLQGQIIFSNVYI